MEAILSGKLASVAEIGTALRAGTNCGSCLPELGTILREAETARGADRTLQEETLVAG
jgi:assimilatory nitrate reductase catalytic subunit